MWRGRMLKGLGVLGAAMAGAVAVCTVAWRRDPSWSDPLPGDGDGLVPGGGIAVTRSVRIQAPPDRVWPWFAQMGQDKAGFYSFTVLENMAGIGMPEVGRIVPEWQGLAVGDHVRLAEDFFLVAARVEPPHLLVLTGAPGSKDPGFDFRWIFSITATPSGSRLIVRERYRPRTLAGTLRAVMGMLGSMIMSAKMLVNVKKLAERS